MKKTDHAENRIKYVFMILFLIVIMSGTFAVRRYEGIFLKLNGCFESLLGMNSYYWDREVYVTDDKYIVSRKKETTTDYEYDETVSLNNFLKENDIRLLYVNKPIKYNDDAFFYDNFGYESFANRNADKFLERIGNAGIKYIDLRDDMEKDGISCEDIFYRTDHHWTVNAGLWAAGIIAEELNKDYGYDIDTSIYNPENYSVKEWKACWLGEQGKLLSDAYVGLDDFTEMKPAFDTDLTFYYASGNHENGTFDNYINEKVYDSGADVYASDSWHYSYQMHNVVNNKVDSGNILILADSYDHVLVPFLSLGVHHIDTLILRDCEEGFDLRDYIIKNGYDTVIISYAELVLGAHDDESNANYRMFIFD